MVNLLLSLILFSVTITPQNVFLDRYTTIPPLGYIKSIATSPFYVVAVSDDYLLFLNKQNFSLEKAIHFDEMIDLIGYDKYYNDLWITSTNSIIRLNTASYTIREYPFSETVRKIGIEIDYIYLDAMRMYSLDKKTGEIKTVNSFPENVTWYKQTSETDIHNYGFLTPYYYNDSHEESQVPLFQYYITCIYDDGLWLYVGTDRYGLLRYNKVSWQKKRMIYGPLDLPVRKVKKFDDKIYFLSSSGISYFSPEKGDWRYRRFVDEIGDLIWVDNSYIFSFEKEIARGSGIMVFTIRNFDTDILSLDADEQNIYIGTKTGLFKIIKGTSEPMPFGPDRYPVHIIYSTTKNVYVGTELGFYEYNKDNRIWVELINQGIKDIVKVQDELYLLGMNNQLIRFQINHSDSSDTNWIPLPYFNIYDIDGDNEVIYCASYAGIHYYEPKTELYKSIFNLPRIRYDHVFIVDDDIMAVSRQNMYRLPIKYRD